MADVFKIPSETPSYLGFLPKPKPEFLQFVRKMLQIANLKTTSIFELTNERNIKIFQLAFIYKDTKHAKTKRNNNNYEFLEYIGDKCLNDKVARYLHWRFPYIIDHGFMTKLFHKISSGKYLADIAIKYGFQQHIIFGNEDDERFRLIIQEGRDITLDTDYRKAMADLIESFCGAIVEICNSADVNGLPLKPVGVSDAIVYNFLANLLNKEEIDTDESTNVSNVMKYNELCIRENKKRKEQGLFPEDLWSADFRNIIITESLTNTGKLFNVKVYGYPNSSKTLLANVTHFNEKDAKDEACKIAIVVLEKEYNICCYKKNPFI